jgi:hypothetical protein
MDFVSLERSPRKNKRFVFEYKDGDKIKKIHFGYEGGSTYIDNKDITKRKNYLARHKVNENWNVINPASLSRWLLWGDTTSLKENLEDYLDRFKIKY